MLEPMIAFYNFFLHFDWKQVMSTKRSIQKIWGGLKAQVFCAVILCTRDTRQRSETTKETQIRKS